VARAPRAPRRRTSPRIADVTISSDGGLERVVAALHAAGHGHLRADLEKRIRQQGSRTLRKVRAAVRSIPSKGVAGGGRQQRGGRGLRAAVADATRIATRTRGKRPGVRFEVRVSRLPVEQWRLPAYLDQQARWRHPVYGNAEVWVRQRTGRPWFGATIRSDERQFAAAVQQALQDTADRITR